MIWIEILSRHRDIAARFRIPGPEARIGRGYDNDVILDDPYVAAQHLRVFRAGPAAARARESQLTDARQPFGRPVTAAAGVQGERVATPERPMVPILLAL